MPKLDSPPDMIVIDVESLLRTDPRLARVGRDFTWDQLGAKIALAFQSPSPLMDPEDDGAPDPAATLSEPPHWRRSKQLVHAVLRSHDPQYVTIRKRLGNLETLSTPALLFTLSLWLAGKLKLSISSARPLVAVMLYAVATSPEQWSLLWSRDPN
ncbi:MAG: hypothetical protein WCO57_13380 [Verrucomicrobiota bacterium]